MKEFRDSFSIIVNRTQSEEIQRLQETFRQIDADFNRRGLINSGFPVEAKCKELKGALANFLSIILPKLLTAIRALGKARFSSARNEIEGYFKEILSARANQIVRTAELIRKSQGAPDYLKREFDSLIQASTVEFHNQLDEYYNISKAAIKQNDSDSQSIDEKAIWQQIKMQFNLSKQSVGRKINFIKDQDARDIVFRDIIQSFHLSQMGFNKPAIILAGGVIEEILLHLLQSKGCSVKGKKFIELINLAKQHSIFENSIHGLLNPLRDFRNLVHIEKERTEFSADKAMAKTTISGLFLIIRELNA